MAWHGMKFNYRMVQYSTGLPLRDNPCILVPQSMFWRLGCLGFTICVLCNYRHQEPCEFLLGLAEKCFNPEELTLIFIFKRPSEAIYCNKEISTTTSILKNVLLDNICFMVMRHDFCTLSLPQ